MWCKAWDIWTKVLSFPTWPTSDPNYTYWIVNHLLHWFRGQFFLCIKLPSVYSLLILDFLLFDLPVLIFIYPFPTISITEIFNILSGRVSPLILLSFSEFPWIFSFFIFHMDFRISLSGLKKNCWYFIGMALNLDVNLERIDIFMMISLLSKKHGLCIYS